MDEDFTNGKIHSAIYMQQQLTFEEKKIKKVDFSFCGNQCDVPKFVHWKNFRAHVLGIQFLISPISQSPNQRRP